MKSCTCMNCEHVFVSKRIRPFCTTSCRTAFMANNPLPAILIGATTDDNHNQSRC